jgi:hypothetical protein
MQDDVPVGVAVQPWRASDLDAAQAQRLPGTEAVPIVSDPDSMAGFGRGHGRLRCHPQSRRCWAKIIRPATVWRTRVTVTSTSLSTAFAPPSTTTIVPSSR